MAERFVAPDKRPGVRPIGMGEVCRWVIARSILRVVRSDIHEAAGPFQLCAGQPAGCEATIYAIQSMYSDPECKELLLVDANNVLNSLNHRLALAIISCPWRRLH